MKLVAGIPEPAEFHLGLTVTPTPPRAGEPAHFRFDVHDPWKNNPVTNFTVIHEKLFHAFIVSRDLEFFLHDHPVWENDSFHYEATLPKPGMYRVLGDFYPEGGTPQLLSKTVFVTGVEQPIVALTPDFTPKVSKNLKVEFTAIPSHPVAGLETQLRFNISPGDGIERYLGAWGHMLVASDDLIDMIHEHPFIADGSPEVLFHVVFPRERMYRIWVQFQRQGVVNTVHFDVPVKPFGTDPFGRIE
jgi:hypothetical protein